MSYIARIVVAVLAVLCLLSLAAEAGHVCRSRDCSDIVGDFLVKDNRMSSKIITHREHLDSQEQSRIRRLEILRRERSEL